jgi:hypothetical protein
MTMAPVVLHTRVYTTLVELARGIMPGETIGLLFGSVSRAGEASSAGEARITVKEARGMPNDYSGGNISDSALERLLERGNEEGGLEVVGWFYADPGVGMFARRLSLEDVQRGMPESARLFLLVNPATDEGAFYQWDGRRYVPTNGFYEAVPNKSSPPLAAWNGEVRGAEGWLGPLLAEIVMPYAMGSGQWAATDDGRTTNDERYALRITHYASGATPVIKRRSVRETLMTVGSVLGIIALLAVLLGQSQTNQGNALISQPAATEVHLGAKSPGLDPSLTGATAGTPHVALAPVPTAAPTLLPTATPEAQPEIVDATATVPSP